MDLNFQKVESDPFHLYRQSGLRLPRLVRREFLRNRDFRDRVRDLLHFRVRGLFHPNKGVPGHLSCRVLEQRIGQENSGLWVPRDRLPHPNRFVQILTDLPQECLVNFAPSQLLDQLLP